MRLTRSGPGCHSARDDLLSQNHFHSSLACLISTYLVISCFCKVDVELSRVWRVVQSTDPHSKPAQLHSLVHASLRAEPDMTKVLLTHPHTCYVVIRQGSKNLPSYFICKESFLLVCFQNNDKGFGAVPPKIWNLLPRGEF